MPQPSPDFDQLIDRSGTHAAKWEKYAGRDVLPFWVADMDFAAPDFLLQALRERLEHPLLGYTRPPPGLSETFCDWLARHSGWQVEPDWLVWIPGVVPGLNLAARAVAADCGSVLIPTPVYYPFLSTPGNAGLATIEVPLVDDGQRWVMDPAALEQACRRDSGLFMLCNPQNPTGRIYRRDELIMLAEFCEQHDLIILSDEIHCSLLLDDTPHVPIASLDPAIAARSVSLFAATKTYNVPGLSCAVAVIPDAGLRRRFRAAQAGLVPGIGPLELVAAEAAFADRSAWLPALLDYLRGNRERVAAVAGERMRHVEATYLAWLDVRDLDQGPPGAYFESQGLGLSDGAPFGGPGYVRFNFACPRELLDRGLERLAAALDTAAR